MNNSETEFNTIGAALSRRSRFCAQPPNGLGTEELQSAENYLQQTAFNNYKTLNDFIALLAPEYKRNSASLKHRTRVKANSLNDCPTLLERIQSEAGLKFDLPQLAFEPVRSLLMGHNHFWSTNRKWCPKCLEEDPHPYERALWRLKPVTHCSKHLTPLETHCPHCNKPIDARAHTPFHYCPSCKRPLKSKKLSRVRPKAKNDAWQQGVHSQLSQMILSLANLQIRTNDKLPELVEHLRDCLDFQSYREMGEYFGFSEATLNNIRHKCSSKTRLSVWLKLSLGSGINLVDLLSNIPSSNLPRSFDPLSSEVLNSYQDTSPRLTQDRMLKIKDYVDSNELGKVSYHQLRLKFGSGYYTLKKHLPDAFNKVPSIRAKYNNTIAAAKNTELRNQIDQGIQLLRHYHLPINRWRLSRIIGTSRIESFERYIHKNKMRLNQSAE